MMKNVKVSEGKIALVFKDGELKNILEQGKHLVPFWGSKVEQFRLSEEFVPVGYDFDLLIKNEKLKPFLNVIEVNDGEIYLKYEKGNAKGVLTGGTYAFWKGFADFKFIKVDLMDYNIQEDVPQKVLETGWMLSYIRTFALESYERGVLVIGDEAPKEIGTGVYRFWKNATPISVAKVDTRKQMLEVSGQEILTKDKANIRINLDAQYKVANVTKALFENKNFDKQLYNMLQLALREYVGTLTLDELLEKKNEVSHFILENVKAQAETLGVNLLGAGIRDIILPGEVKEIMNQVLVAQKKAQANSIMRREETASTRSLLNTAKLMEDNQMLFKLKEMEYVEKIADNINGITVSGGGQIVDQLRQIFTVNRE